MYTNHNGNRNAKDTTGRENTTYLDNADETRKTKGTKKKKTPPRTLNQQGWRRTTQGLEGEGLGC